MHSLEELHVALLACLHPNHHRQHDIASDCPGERIPGGLVAVAASAGLSRGVLLAPPPSRRSIAGRLLACLSPISMAGAAARKRAAWHGVHCSGGRCLRSGIVFL
jgi:hypothetical protein